MKVESLLQNSVEHSLLTLLPASNARCVALEFTSLAVKRLAWKVFIFSSTLKPLFTSESGNIRKTIT